MTIQSERNDLLNWIVKLLIIMSCDYINKDEGGWFKNMYLILHNLKLKGNK